MWRNGRLCAQAPVGTSARPAARTAVSRTIRRILASSVELRAGALPAPNASEATREGSTPRQPDANAAAAELFPAIGRRPASAGAAADSAAPPRTGGLR